MNAIRVWILGSLGMTEKMRVSRQTRWYYIAPNGAAPMALRPVTPRGERVMRRTDAFQWLAKARSCGLVSRQTQSRQEKRALLRDPQVLRRRHHNGCDGP
jgi:hypothetical protein